MSKLRTVICLFRNDLRLHDNETLVTAQSIGDLVIPLYCFDPAHYKGTWHFNFPKTGSHRSKFLIESVQDLRASLRKFKSDLIVHNTSPLEAIKHISTLCETKGDLVTDVIFQKEVTFEEVKVEDEIEAFCRNRNIKIRKTRGSTLYHIQDLPFKNISFIPDTYTSFRKDVEARSKVRRMQEIPASFKPLPAGLAPGNVPTMEELGHNEYKQDKRSAFPFRGGETAALDRIDHYLWKTDSVAKYKETRNGLVGVDYSTKFSTWLAAGCVSPRRIFWEIKKYEESRVANNSTYWVIFELIWRDYFKFVCQKYGDRVFYKSGILNKHLPWSQDMKKFEAWAEGRTGVPFVDANMRELKHSGWMSNRGRQNVASFLVKDLGLDWRLGAEWFESQLLDHDVCSNYGNWNYAAGIGNDPRENRKFNMIKQGIDYDKEGEFVRLWVEELAGLRGTKIHFPWSIAPTELERAGVKLGLTYPKPLVTAPEWAKHTGRTGQGGGQQRGIDFYFKPSGNQNHQNKNNHAQKYKKPALRGGRVQ